MSICLMSICVMLCDVMLCDGNLRDAIRGCLSACVICLMSVRLGKEEVGGGEEQKHTKTTLKTNKFTRQPHTRMLEKRAKHDSFLCASGDVPLSPNKKFGLMPNHNNLILLDRTPEKVLEERSHGHINSFCVFMMCKDKRKTAAGDCVNVFFKCAWKRQTN